MMYPGTVKFHNLLHYADNIREWGCPSNTNVETWETAHKWFVKRWMGKMQYNRNGCISMVMRRNLIAEMHRGSLDLLPTARKNRNRDNYSVLNAVRGTIGMYRQFLHAATGIWVHCGDAIQYRDDSNMSDNGTVARVESIRVCANGILSVEVMKYNSIANTGGDMRQLESAATKWVLETDASRRLTILPIENDLSLFPFPLQPDFDNYGVYFFNCPWMRIVL